MKTLRNIILTLVFVLAIPMIFLAQGDEPLQSIGFGGIVMQIALVTVVAAISTGFNHLVAGTFSITIWLSDTFIPALIAFGVSIALASIDLYVESIDPLIEQLIGAETNAYDSSGLAIVAFALVPLIKGLFKIKSTRKKFKK